VRGDVVCVNNKRGQACPDREIRVYPTEGALVRSVPVALNQRRAQRIWRDGTSRRG